MVVENEQKTDNLLSAHLFVKFSGAKLLKMSVTSYYFFYNSYSVNDN